MKTDFLRDDHKESIPNPTKIRKAKIADLPDLYDVFEHAKQIMRNSGNLHQWDNNYPGEKLLRQDIEKGQLYVVEEDGIVACFVLQEGDDPTYAKIDGAWRSSSPYMTIHRIAKRGGSSIFKEVMAFAKTKSKHLRIDTHADNAIMQHLIIENGFHYCGIIYLENGDRRLAYEYLELED